MEQSFVIERVDSRTDQAVKALVELWEASVRATHDFLTEADIQALIPDVEAGLKGVAELVLARDRAGAAIGFMGIDSRKIEMLFVEPKWFGKGVGSRLIRHAVEACGADAVDVNEQNPGALGFYEHMGFRVKARSPLDEQGRSFPVLHMERGAADVTYCDGNQRFNLRAAALIMHQNRILVMRDGRSPYYYLPGGRVRLGETAEEAIKRELSEELGLSFKIKRLAWVVESFFTEDVSRESFHEIGFYYVVDGAGDSLLERGDAFEFAEKSGNILSFVWMDVEDVPKAYVYPAFIKKHIRNIPDRVEHIVEDV